MGRYRDPLSLTEAIHRKNSGAIDGFIKHQMGINEARERRPRERALPSLPLTEAVRQGDLDLVNRLIKAGADPNGLPYLETPMSAAINKGNLAVLDALHNAGASIVDPQGGKSLYSGYMGQACSMAGPEVLAWLIEHGGEAREINRGGFSLVHVTLQNYRYPQDKEKLRLLRDHGADLLHCALVKGNHVDPDRRVHPFSRAVAVGDREVVEWFLAAGADPNMVCDDTMYVSGAYQGQGLPVLACALLGNSPGGAEVVSILIEHGARLDVRVDFNQNTNGPVCEISDPRRHLDNPSRIRHATYLMLASAWSNAKCVGALISHGMDPNAADSNGGTALSTFIQKAGLGGMDRGMDVLGVLLKGGCNPNQADNHGNTVMHLLSQMGKLWGDTSNAKMQQWLQQLAAMLIEHGGDVTLPNNDGLSAIDVGGGPENPILSMMQARGEVKSMQSGTIQPAGRGRHGLRL